MRITNVVPFEQVRKQELEFSCSKCGADRGCDCNAPAIKKAAAAIAANPQKSDRAIAAEIGVDHKTVGKVRRARGDDSPPEAAEVRIGRDGKSYKAKKKPTAPLAPTAAPPTPAPATAGNAADPASSAAERMKAYAADADAVAIGELYRKARRSVVDSLHCWAEAGRRLAAKKKELPHGEWLPWLKANADALGFSNDSTARRLMKAATKVDERIATKSAANFATTAEPNRALTHDLDEDEAVELNRQIWNNKPANYSSESVEWYTPPKYIDAVRELLGGIDLDPASNDKANAWIKAKQIYTAADDGLARPWRGRVFVNPPYGTENGKSVAGAWCQRAMDQYESGAVEACVILVNSVHDQSWQEPLFAFPVCLVDHRIKFLAGDGTENENPTNRNLFVYLGNDRAKFAEVFSRFGWCCRRENYAPRASNRARRGGGRMPVPAAAPSSATPRTTPTITMRRTSR
jgi:hypothetical protein